MFYFYKNIYVVIFIQNVVTRYSAETTDLVTYAWLLQSFSPIKQHPFLKNRLQTSIQSATNELNKVPAPHFSHCFTVYITIQKKRSVATSVSSQLKESKSYRFGKILGWVNDNRIFCCFLSECVSVNYPFEIFCTLSVYHIKF